MFQYVVRRLAYGVITLFLLSVITFTLMQNTGGSPLDRITMNPRFAREYVEQLTAFYGLDKPAVEQYFTWARHFVAGLVP